MEAASDLATQPYILHSGEGEAVWFVNNRATIKASNTQTGGTFGLVEMLAAPGHAPPLHVHHTEDESMWVLQGQLTVQCNGETFTAGPGSFLYMPRGSTHTFRVDSTTPARLLVLLIPGGGEQFFVDAGRPVENDGLPEPAPPDVARLQTVAERFGVEFVGPPLAPASTH